MFNVAQVCKAIGKNAFSVLKLKLQQPQKQN